MFTYFCGIVLIKNFSKEEGDMKTVAKKLLSLILVVCLAFMGVIVTPFVTASAAESTTETLTITGSTGTLASDSSSISWTSGNITFINKKGSTAIRASDTAHYRVYSGSTGSISTNNGAKITKIVITATSNSYANAAVASVKIGDAVTASANGTMVTIECDPGEDSVEYASTAQWRLSSIEVTYKAVDTTEPHVTITGDNHMQVGQTLTLTATTNVTGTVAWSSSNEDVATVANGVVTAKTRGTTTITATVEGTDVSDTIDITVCPSNANELTIAEAIELCEWTGNTATHCQYTTTGTIASIDTVYSSTYNNITVTITDGTDSILAFRMIGGEELTVGMKITVTGTLVNYSGNTPEFDAGCTYVTVLDETASAAKEAVDVVKAYMSLAYKYTETTKEVETSADATISFATTDNRVSQTTEQQVWQQNGITVTNDKTSGSNDIVDSFNPVRFYKNSTLTVESTSMIKIEFACNTTSYATALKNSISDSTVSVSDKTVAVVFAEAVNSYTITLSDGQVRMDSIKFYSNVGATTETKTVLENSDFRIRCGVDAGLADIANVDSYGIRVTAGGKTVDYSTDANSWGETTDGKAYVLISLGDIVNNVARLQTAFTVQAYVVVDGVTYVSTLSKTYSVASMVAEYYNQDAEAVEHLYNYLVEIGAI